MWVGDEIFRKIVNVELRNKKREIKEFGLKWMWCSDWLIKGKGLKEKKKKKEEYWIRIEERIEMKDWWNSMRWKSRWELLREEKEWKNRIV